MSLLPSERAQYSAIIDGILATSDLQTISAKQIRKGLQAKLEIDISFKKEAVQELIMERFDKASTAAPPISDSDTKPQAVSKTNGYASPLPVKTIKVETKVKSETPPSGSTPEDEDEDSEVEVPPKKKRKHIKASKEMDDAQLAAMLQAQENSRTRATRGGGTKKKAVVKKKTPKKKSADRVKADDDSDMELDSSGEVKEKVRKGGFHKQYHLGESLADLVGEPTLSRPQVVKKIWEYIKARDLQDPADKRQIRCDEKMYAVFRSDKVHMFTMNKILGKQLYPIEE